MALIDLPQQLFSSFGEGDYIHDAAVLIETPARCVPRKLISSRSSTGANSRSRAIRSRPFLEQDRCEIPQSYCAGPGAGGVTRLSDGILGREFGSVPTYPLGNGAGSCTVRSSTYSQPLGSQRKAV